MYIYLQIDVQVWDMNWPVPLQTIEKSSKVNKMKQSQDQNCTLPFGLWTKFLATAISLVMSRRCQHLASAPKSIRDGSKDFQMRKTAKVPTSSWIPWPCGCHRNNDYWWLIIWGHHQFDGPKFPNIRHQVVFYYVVARSHASIAVTTMGDTELEAMAFRLVIAERFAVYSGWCWEHLATNRDSREYQPVQTLPNWHGNLWILPLDTAYATQASWWPCNRDSFLTFAK